MNRGILMNQNIPEPRYLQTEVLMNRGILMNQRTQEPRYLPTEVLLNIVYSWSKIFLNRDTYQPKYIGTGKPGYVPKKQRLMHNTSVRLDLRVN